MNNDLKIRLFKINEIDVLQQAIDNLWSKNHVLSRDKSLLKYMFYENPKHSEVLGKDNLGFLGAWYKGKIIGLMGLMVNALNLRGNELIGISPTNWIVSKDYRYTGAGLYLMREMMKYEPSLVLNLGINSNVAQLYSKMGNYYVINEVPRWIGIVNMEAVNKLLLENNKSYLRYFNEIALIDNNNINYKISNEFNHEKWDEFFYREFSQKYLGFSRNSLFINWRYLNHPTFKYRFISCFDANNNYKGLIVYRIEEILNKQAKIGRIVECIISDQDSAISLANQLVLIGRGENLLFFDFYCFSSLNTWGLETIGFKREFKSSNDKIVLPTRFQPLDLKITNMMASIYVGKDIRKDINLINDQLWYITKGDADQDRPN